MKRVLPVILILCLMLCACGSKEEAASAPTEQETVPTQTTPPTQPEETTQPTESTEPEVNRNPLTGEPVDAPWTARPFAVTLNNTSAALPHHGTSQADIIYEALVEGGVTRCLAIFSDIAEVEVYGSVRSARHCFVDISRAYDAIFVHAGGSPGSLSYLEAIGWDDLDGITGAAVSYFYRDSARLKSGYSLEHTLFTSGPNLIEFATKKGYDLTRQEGIDYGLRFAEDGTPDGETANQIVLHFRSSGKTTTMTYNSETGLYEGYQLGKDMIDGNTGEVVGFQNVFAIFAKTTMEDIYTMMELTGSGDGYFACGGKIVPICWSRESDDSPFVYTLTDGTPLTLGIGTSYVGILPTGSPVNYE